MRHQTMQPLAVSGFDTTFGRVVPPGRRGQLVPPTPVQPRPAPLIPQNVAANVIAAFETKGKEAGLKAAAGYKSKIIMDAAVEYLASRKMDKPALEQKLANIRAQETNAKEINRTALLRSLEFRKAFTLARLQAVNAGKKQAVADIAELPAPARNTPSWVPYLTLGIAIAGFVMAVGRSKK